MGSEIVYNACCEDEDIIIKAFCRPDNVGHVNCELEGTCLFLADIQVEPAFQGRGIGLELLRRALDAARHAGATEVWGYIVENDRTDKLLTWYAARGFSIADADADADEECRQLNPHAVKKITKAI